MFQCDTWLVYYWDPWFAFFFLALLFLSYSPRLECFFCYCLLCHSFDPVFRIPIFTSFSRFDIFYICVCTMIMTPIQNYIVWFSCMKFDSGILGETPENVIPTSYSGISVRENIPFLGPFLKNSIATRYISRISIKLTTQQISWIMKKEINRNKPKKNLKPIFQATTILSGNLYQKK